MNTYCVKDLDKFNLVKFAYGGLVLGPRQFLVMYAPPASKNDALFKSCQKRLKNDHFNLLGQIRDNMYENVENWHL